ncbi:MAG TPA: transposase [Longimicrobiales bacterium]
MVRRSERFALEPQVARAAARRAAPAGPAGDGRHPGWRDYLNGPDDYRLLQRIRGIGPRRAELLMTACGGLSAFLSCSPAEVCRRTDGRIRASLAETLQHRARAQQLATRYVHVETALQAERDEEEREAARLPALVHGVARRLRRWARARQPDAAAPAVASAEAGSLRAASSEPRDALVGVVGRVGGSGGGVGVGDGGGGVDRPGGVDGDRIGRDAGVPDGAGVVDGAGSDPELNLFLAPFVACLRHKSQRRWAPVYVRGLLEPAERKGVTALAGRLAPRDVQQLHHFVAASRWDPDPLCDVLAREAARLAGGPGARLVASVTSLPKKGRHSVGVARQSCPERRRPTNCQLVVTLMLVRDGIAACAALSPYLPAEWAGDRVRRRTAGVPDDVSYRPLGRIALDEVDRVVAAGARFDAVVLDPALGAGGPGKKSVGRDAAGGALACARAEHARLKRECGLDRFEGRGWLGLRHHLVLVGMAHGYRCRRELEARAAQTGAAEWRGDAEQERSGSQP